MTRTLDLTIGGMTCASCAARVEKRLNKLDGVTATVNYTTEKARVTFPDVLPPETLLAVVEATGYTAAMPTPETPQGPGTQVVDPRAEHTTALRQRVLICPSWCSP